jgi:hypothetical protein
MQVRPGPAHRPVAPPGRFERLRRSAYAGHDQPPSGWLVVSFIVVGQSDWVLVQSGGEVVSTLVLLTKLRETCRAELR